MLSVIVGFYHLVPCVSLLPIASTKSNCATFHMHRRVSWRIALLAMPVFLLYLTVTNTSVWLSYLYVHSMFAFLCLVLYPYFVFVLFSLVVAMFPFGQLSVLFSALSCLLYVTSYCILYLFSSKIKKYKHTLCSTSLARQNPGVWPNVQPGLAG